MFYNISRVRLRNFILILYWRRFRSIKCLKTYIFYYSTNWVVQSYFKHQEQGNFSYFYYKSKWTFRWLSSQCRESKNPKVFFCLTVVGTIFRQSYKYLKIFCAFYQRQNNITYTRKKLCRLVLDSLVNTVDLEITILPGCNLKWDIIYKQLQNIWN